jgi:hypothetical protein
MKRMKQNRRRNLVLLASISTCLLVACSVDTDGIKFVPDDEFGSIGEGGDGVGTGGVVNAGGKATSGDGGEPDVEEGGKPSGGTGGKGGSGGAQGGNPPLGGGPPQGGNPPLGGNGNMAGTGGTTMSTTYPCSSVRAPALIADFENVMSVMDSWQDKDQTARFGLYLFPPNNGLTFRLGGALTAEGKVTSPMGVGIWASRCLDATGYTKLSFSAHGYGDNGQDLALRVSIFANDNQFVDPNRRIGNCVPPQGQDAMMYCRPPSTEVKLPASSQMGQLITIPFTAFNNGSPAQMLKPSEIVAIEFGFIYLNGSSYSGSLTIDNVRFE